MTPPGITTTTFPSGATNKQLTRFVDAPLYFFAGGKLIFTCFFFFI
jgi:hypothetical protein